MSFPHQVHAFEAQHRIREDDPFKPISDYRTIYSTALYDCYRDGSVDRMKASERVDRIYVARFALMEAHLVWQRGL